MLDDGLRTIIVGDVHGCRGELEGLLDRLVFASGDRLVFVGDLVARGPDSLGVLDVVRRTGAIVVRGNHEQKLLDWRRARTAWMRGEAAAKPPIGRMHRDIARSLPCCRTIGAGGARREPVKFTRDFNVVRRRFRGVRAVNEVVDHRAGEVAANRAGKRLSGLRRADHRASQFDRVRPLPNHPYHRSRRDEIHEFAEKGSLLVHRVVRFSGFASRG